MRRNKWLAWLLIVSLILSTFMTNASVSLANTNNESSSLETDQVPTSKPSIKALYSDYNTISSWAVVAIQQATNQGFIQGSDGKFNPQSSITRAEFTKILVLLLNLETDVEQTISFADVASKDWHYDYVNVAYKNGLINGYNNKFNPQATITREEMAVIISRALKLTTDTSKSSIKDINKISAWAKLDVEAVVRLGIIVGDAAGFNPQAAVTREMAAVVAVRSYLYKQDTEAYITSLEVTKINNQLKKTATFLLGSVTDPIIASVGGDWTVFGLARSGKQIDQAYYAKYYGNVVQTLKDNAGKLHNVKYTEYDRVILALTAIGKDIKDVAGYDLRKPLADYETLIKQGINGPIFALIALDSKNYEILKVEGVKTQTTRELLIQFILDREIAGGGWALGSNPTEADTDITAMAVQGLTPYYKSDVKVKAAVDRGLAWLSTVLQSDGIYTSWGAANSESIAQVVVALTGLGINPDQDTRFIKNGESVVDALLGYASSNGGFYHVKSGGADNGGAKPGEVDLMATDQAFYALSSYERFLTNKNRLYDMTDVK
ncbi:S-layer homology domain-containing protein [Paenibacillus endoradicis]|uniref:S-layer homology domain-containing protein n=1 Tax=Paenibacillus endoradicis TaxID=2972487 RepID=UPI00215958FF|nr:S-layer homology domain-containing protein [Paenibacillus endoradicis]MCR8660411.1 S-layer homology domain-containing protein [Paenibacillus endoradicis]